MYLKTKINGDRAGAMSNVGSTLAATTFGSDINLRSPSLSSIGDDSAFITGANSACVGLFPSLSAARADAASSLAARNLYARAQPTLPLGIEIPDRNFWRLLTIFGQKTMNKRGRR
ncbi:MAG: hypothetical protein LBP26_03810 [Clostridiales bacterium]|jgi:hypothetical protein|nr:hypothetical protein [Clostridiales bacterium]